MESQRQLFQLYNAWPILVDHYKNLKLGFSQVFVPFSFHHYLESQPIQGH